ISTIRPFSRVCAAATKRRSVSSYVAFTARSSAPRTRSSAAARRPGRGQDTWLAVVGNISSFEGRSSLATWLFTIAANRARTRAKREGRMVALAPPSAEGEERAVETQNFRADGRWIVMPRLWHDLDPEREIGGRQLRKHVEAVIEQLPPNQKAVLILRDIERGSAEEACEVLDVSAENQRVLLHRARPGSAVDRRAAGRGRAGPLPDR